VEGQEQALVHRVHRSSLVTSIRGPGRMGRLVLVTRILVQYASPLHQIPNRAPGGLGRDINEQILGPICSQVRLESDDLHLGISSGYVASHSDSQRTSKGGVIYVSKRELARFDFMRRKAWDTASRGEDKTGWEYWTSRKVRLRQGRLEQPRREDWILKGR
jgi:hypothetical protein